jgi:hypothetical protein
MHIGVHTTYINMLTKYGKKINFMRSKKKKNEIIIEVTRKYDNMAIYNSENINILYALLEI